MNIELDRGINAGAENKESAINPNQALWEKGDFTRIAATMRASGELFVRRLGIEPGMKVLDLGCGDGTTAVPAARLGAEVLGVDIARNLIEAGSRRADELGLSNLRFEEGDATKLQGLEDGAFDLVITVFGAMFAPRPDDVAREMARVTRPGGRIVMGNWIPGDPTFVAQVLRISSAYSPAPLAGFVSPMLWGVEAKVIERFENAGIARERVRFERNTWVFEATMPPSDFLTVFRNYYGPTMNAYEAAEKSGRVDQLHRELETLVHSQNNSARADRTSIPATFLRVTVEV